jgi:hypothetical protein
MDRTCRILEIHKDIFVVKFLEIGLLNSTEGFRVNLVEK